MLNTFEKHYPFNDDLKLNLQSFFAISIGIFLFLLFFQPFLLKNPDFNNQYLIIAGFAAISFIFFVGLRIFIPSVFQKVFDSEKWNFGKEFILNLVFVSLNSVAYTFYARYVGEIMITFHTATLFVLLSISSMVINIVINELRRLNNQVKQLSELAGISDEIAQLPEKNVEIEFESENKSDFFQLPLEQIILIKSANNYIEVIYKSIDKVNRRLIRNTIKNTEELFSRFPSLVRCHRSCIVNKNYVQKILKRSDGMRLVLFDYPIEIPVSRQYILKVKETLKYAF